MTAPMASAAEELRPHRRVLGGAGGGRLPARGARWSRWLRAEGGNLFGGVTTSEGSGRMATMNIDDAMGVGVPLTGQQAKIYTKLWTLSDEASPPVFSTYGDEKAMRTTAELGLFALYDGDRPFLQIRVKRDPNCPDGDEADPAGADLRELFTLAHERGHEASWREDTYEVTTMAEERRAWSHAEKLLRDRGFDDWIRFEAAKRASLSMHQKRSTPEATLPPRPRCKGKDHVYSYGQARCDCGLKMGMDFQ